MCYIQLLEQHQDGWHIRFGGPSDEFWTMLSNFKAEQKRSGQVKCHFDPRLFKGQGGWFCTEDILLKYSTSFSNYADMRQKAIQDYQQSGKAEEDRRRKEAEETARKARQEAWDRAHEQWREEQFKRRREEERAYQQRRSTNNNPPSTSLQLTEALTELGLEPLTPLAKLDEKQIKAAYHAKALKAHPDTGGSHQAFIRLNKAYQLVLFQVQRAGVR